MGKKRSLSPPRNGSEVVDRVVGAEEETKKRRKKAKKWAERGEVWCESRLVACESSGIVLRPLVRVSKPARVAGARVATLKDVGNIVWRIIGCRSPHFSEAGTMAEARKEWPPWLELGNAAVAKRCALLFGKASCPQLTVRCYDPKHASFHPEKRAALDLFLRQPPPWERESVSEARPTVSETSMRRVRLDEEVEKIVLVTPQELIDNNYPKWGEQRSEVDLSGLTNQPEDQDEYTVPSPETAKKIIEAFSGEQLRTVELPDDDGGGERRRRRRRVWGLDCEMVQTSRGSECARCTLVDDDDQICIDELVHPELTVIDYCTQYSGIDKETLDPVTTTLAQIQAMFLSVVDARDVLVGHSLDNDLRCLKIYHATCADTSLSYKHARGPGYKRSLRHLAKEFLGKTIQDGAHDSVVDAKTALDLLRLKVRHGPDFGAPSRNNTSRHFLATAAALPDTRVAFCGPDPKPYAKGNVSAIKSDDLSKHVAGGGWHLLVAHNSTEDAAVLARHLPNDAILIVVDQPNLDDLSALEKRKRACVDPRSASEWTDDLEASRLELLDRSMSASIAVFSNEDI